MRISRLRFAALAGVGLVLSGCAYDMYGDNYGYGYAPYGGLSVGIGYGGGYGGYYGYGYPYGGYGYDPFGWYGDYYYPGSGIYVYDRYRHRHEWTDEQRRYWEQRRQQWHDHHSGTSTGPGENWSGWDRSHWHGHDQGLTPTTTTTAGGWHHGSGSWTHESSETRSSVTSGDHSSHHSRESSNERPQ